MTVNQLITELIKAPQDATVFVNVPDCEDGPLPPKVLRWVTWWAYPHNRRTPNAIRLKLEGKDT